MADRSSGRNGVRRPLSTEERRLFLDEGYLIVQDVIDRGVVQAVIEDLDAEVDRRARKLFERGEISSLYEDEGFETRLAKISAETPKLAVAIWNGVLHSPGIFRLITHEPLLDMAESLCGPELIASSVYRLRPKIPRFGYGEVPWHQDSGYLVPFCDSSLIVTMWVPLVDSTTENGCLVVIPRSHRGAVVGHRLHASGKYLEIPAENLSPGEWVACPVPKGGVVLLTNRTMHASFKNTTDRVRWSMDLRYQSAALPTNANIPRFPDEYGHAAQAGVPSACYPPEADFLVRSARRPEAVLRTYAEFEKLRTAEKLGSVTNRFGVTWRPMAVDDIE